MGKNAVIYFSVYGTAKKTAAEIASQVGADLIEIEPVTAYDSNRDHYDALARLTKAEHDQDMRPPIKNEINVREYDNIFLGYPIWRLARSSNPTDRVRISSERSAADKENPKVNSYF